MDVAWSYPRQADGDLEPRILGVVGVVFSEAVVMLFNPQAAHDHGDAGSRGHRPLSCAEFLLPLSR